MMLGYAGWTRRLVNTMHICCAQPKVGDSLMKPPLLNFVLHLTNGIVANRCSQTPN
jgi:hypothetical protein